MFGYITIDQPEIKFKDYYKYRAYYCGLCHSLKEQHGQLSRLALGYDMTFLAILLDGLYDSETKQIPFRCPGHPMQKRVRIANEFLDYAADMDLFLAYLKCDDDWNDEKKIHRKLYGSLIRGRVQAVENKYPEKTQRIREHLQKLAELEKEGSQDFETAAGCFGNVTAEIFRYREDMWAPHLQRMGFFLGKFIYLMDAYEDLAEDREKGLFNPLKDLSSDPAYEEKMYDILMMMIAEAADAFEMLPLDENMEILRNIIYSGVWKTFRKENDPNE